MTMRDLAKHVALMTLCCCFSTTQAEVYQWNDANGKTHFSDKNPNASAETGEQNDSVKKIDKQPINQFSAEDVFPSEKEVDALNAKRLQEKQQHEAIQTKRQELQKAEAEEKALAANSTYPELGPGWDWHNGVVKNPAFNSSLTKTNKGDFILRTEHTPCKERSFKAGKKYEMNVNSNQVRFTQQCVGGLVSLIPDSMRDNNYIDKQFSRSQGSVDIGGVLFGTKGYK